MVENSNLIATFAIGAAAIWVLVSAHKKRQEDIAEAEFYRQQAIEENNKTMAEREAEQAEAFRQWSEKQKEKKKRGAGPVLI